MRYEIIFAPEAMEELKYLDAHQRAMVKDAIEVHLRHEPRKESRTTIKRLRDLIRPQYRLRVEQLRVFYDVRMGEVEIITIISKDGALSWLERKGVRS